MNHEANQIIEFLETIEDFHIQVSDLNPYYAYGVLSDDEGFWT